VYAATGISLVPLSFLAIRIADTLIHPVVVDSSGLNMTGSMAAAFLVMCVGMISLAVAMMQVETRLKVLSAALAMRTRNAETVPTAEAGARG
jgi:heme exporter protein C